MKTTDRNPILELTVERKWHVHHWNLVITNGPLIHLSIFCFFVLYTLIMVMVHLHNLLNSSPLIPYPLSSYSIWCITVPSSSLTSLMNPLTPNTLTSSVPTTKFSTHWDSPTNDEYVCMYVYVGVLLTNKHPFIYLIDGWGLCGISTSVTVYLG